MRKNKVQGGCASSNNHGKKNNGNKKQNQSKTQTITTNTTKNQQHPTTTKKTNNQNQQITLEEFESAKAKLLKQLSDLEQLKPKEVMVEWKPKCYEAIDENIHKIQTLGISEFGKKFGLEEGETFDEVEYWLGEKAKSYSPELINIFNEETRSRKVFVDEDILFQLISFVHNPKTKLLYNPELFRSCKKLEKSLQCDMIHDYKAFIKSVAVMVKEGREKLKEKNKENE